MHFTNTLTTFLVGVGAATAFVLPRQVNSTNTTTLANTTTLPTSPLDSDTFILRAQSFANTSISLGYLHAEYAYPPGYYASLVPLRSDAIQGHLSDTTNATNSSLVFSNSTQGLVLYPLSSQSNASIAQIFSGQTGTKGVFVDEGGLLGWAQQRVAWYGEFGSYFF